MLDSDQDGKISANQIDITNIQYEALETFAPLLCKMEEDNTILDENGFIKEAIKLLNASFFFHWLYLLEKRKYSSKK